MIDLVPGANAAGIIEKVADGVTVFAPGDRVACTLRNGAYATHRVIDDAQVVGIPGGGANETAARRTSTISFLPSPAPWPSYPQ